MSLSSRRRDDVPFIGSDPEDFYYQTESGGVFDMTNHKFFADFDEWWNDASGYCLRCETILGDIREGNIDAIKEWMQLAFLDGERLGYEECCAQYQREDDV